MDIEEEELPCKVIYHTNKAFTAKPTGTEESFCSFIQNSTIDTFKKFWFEVFLQIKKRGYEKFKILILPHTVLQQSALPKPAPEKCEPEADTSSLSAFEKRIAASFSVLEKNKKQKEPKDQPDVMRIESFIVKVFTRDEETFPVHPQCIACHRDVSLDIQLHSRSPNDPSLTKLTGSDLLLDSSGFPNTILSLDTAARPRYIIAPKEHVCNLTTMKTTMLYELLSCAANLLTQYSSPYESFVFEQTGYHSHICLSVPIKDFSAQKKLWGTPIFDKWLQADSLFIARNRPKATDLLQSKPTNTTTFKILRLPFHVNHTTLERKLREKGLSPRLITIVTRETFTKIGHVNFESELEAVEAFIQVQNTRLYGLQRVKCAWVQERNLKRRLEDPFNNVANLKRRKQFHAATEPSSSKTEKMDVNIEDGNEIDLGF